MSAGAYYDLAENANLKVSRLESGLSGVEIFDQRHAVLAEGARADFSAAELGGENIYVHSYGLLAGDHSAMTEKAVYAGTKKQHLDFLDAHPSCGKENPCGNRRERRPG